MRTYELKKQRGMPLYESLYRSIREDILRGDLQPGEKLPSKRALAENLEVGKTTVEAAYAELLDEGYIRAEEKVGYFVEPVSRTEIAPPEEADEPAAPEEAPLDLIGGGTGHFPFTVWNRLQREAVLDYDKALLSPMPPFGMLELRRAIAVHLAGFRGMQVKPENILVGAGTDFLYNILVQLLGRDRLFGVEEPGYSKIRRIYTAGGAKCVSIPVETAGPEEIPQAVGVLHISPSHQYPTGLVMPVKKRREILSWAEAGDRYIIEDDFDSEFRTTAHPKPAMQSMNPERVIYMNSFSKSLAPSIRIGFLVLPEELKLRFQRKLGFYSCTVPSFEQVTLARFLQKGYFEKHINRMRKFYRNRASALRRVLAQSPAGASCRLMEQEAGLHFLLEVDTSLSDEALVRVLENRGVQAKTLAQYYEEPSAAQPHFLVVNYAGLEEEDFQKALEILWNILKA